MKKILFFTAFTLSIASPVISMMNGPAILGRPQSKGEWDQATRMDDWLVSSFRANNIENVCSLIKDGANQEKPIRFRKDKSCWGRKAGSLLIIAILEENIPMAHALIKEGANCNARCYEGDALQIAYGPDQPALVLAAERNMTSVCKLLLERGAVANAQTNDGETALAWAAENKNEELVDLLFNKYKAQFVPHLKKKKPCCPSSCSIQ